MTADFEHDDGAGHHCGGGDQPPTFIPNFGRAARRAGEARLDGFGGSGISTDDAVGGSKA